MRIFFTRFCYLMSCLVGLSQVAAAQTLYAPADVTGYTADVIADGAGTVASSTTNAVDRGNAQVRWCFANTTFVNPSGVRPVLALPASGLINSITTTGLTFQMAPANQNNSLRIDGANAGTLTLTNPQACSEVVVLATEGNGSTAPKIFTVTFTDGSTQVFSNVVVPDWFATAGATPAVIVGSRVSYIDNSVDNVTTNPRLFEVHLNLLVANYSKRVQSVGVSKASTDPVLNVMGISLGANCLGVPVGGAAVASVSSVCPGSPVALSLVGNTATATITYQWQSAPVGSTTWTNIPGATAAIYVTSPTVTAQYRAVLTCNLQASNSTPVTVTVLPAVASVAYSTTVPSQFCAVGTQPVLTVTPTGGTFSSTTGLSINATTGLLNLAASTPGTYTVTYTLPTGACAPPATTQVIVTAPVVPTLAYSAASYCQAATNTPAPAVSPAGGTFSSTTGLAISATTGVINLGQSTIGTYTVSYTASGLCGGTTTRQVIIAPTPTATITYGGTDFCKSGSSPTPTVTPTGGTFSSTAGLSLNPTTGVINLATSTNGSYTITYTSSGPCSSTATATLNVKGSLPPIYPNVLTPNGDKLNDELLLPIADVTGYSLQVYNRWGRRVYEGNDAKQGWNPADNSGGIYYYLIEYTDCAGRPQKARNWVEVIK